METGARAVLIYRIYTILFEEKEPNRWPGAGYIARNATKSALFPKKPIDQFTDEELVATLERLIYYKFRSR